MSSLMLLASALSCGACPAGENGATSGITELPVNTWTNISEHPTKLGKLVPMVWLPEQKRGLVWGALHYRQGIATREEYLSLYLFDPRTGKWETRPSAFPGKSEVVFNTKAGWSYIYLPGLKRVLLLGDTSGKLKAGSWLLDPVGAKWEPVPGMTRMRDNSKDFGAYSPYAYGCGSSNRDGYSVPILGALCYDAQNREAVSVGGGEVWGRVEKVKEKVKVGDWIYDEALDPKRVRRLVAADEGKITEARKFYPGHCGTWTFSEATKQWTPLDQLLSEQPSGRMQPGVAYDAGEKKIVLFGGDDLAGCLGDTWIYDCETKKWSEVKPKNPPPARACAGMVYVPDQRVILMAGGYGTGWTTRTDVWAYETAKNKWTRLGPDLPVQVGYCWADYLPEEKTVLLRALVETTYRPEMSHIYGLRLDFAAALKPNDKMDAGKQYHCQVKDKVCVSGQPAPEDWAAPTNKASDPEVVKKELAALPANTWKQLQPPLKTVERRWGTCIYNPRTHKLYAYGGAHGGYQGGDVSEYDLLTNRWTGMVDPPEMKARHHARAGGDNTQGVSFGGGAWTSHAHGAWGIDPLSNNIITPYGFLYSIEERRYVGMMSRCPGRWSQSDIADDGSTPHGLYGYSTGGLYRLNVAGHKWDPVLEGKHGPVHRDQNSMCYDPKRDAIWYFARNDNAAVWCFDFKAKKWAKQKVEGQTPALIGGWPAYIPKMDGALFTYNPDYAKKPVRSGGKPQLFFFNTGEKKWYVTPYEGETFGSYGNLNNDVFWDPELKLVLHAGLTNFTEVGVMRLVPEKLGLKPLGE